GRGSRGLGAGPTSRRDVPEGGPQARRPASPQARWRRTAAHCRTHARAEPLSAGPPPWERSADRAAPERPGTHTSTPRPRPGTRFKRSEEHTSELQSRENLVCRLLLEKKKNKKAKHVTGHKLTDLQH